MVGIQVVRQCVCVCVCVRACVRACVRVCVFMFNLTLSSISLYESIIYSTALSAGCMLKNTRVIE